MLAPAFGHGRGRCTRWSFPLQRETHPTSGCSFAFRRTVSSKRKELEVKRRTNTTTITASIASIEHILLRERSTLSEGKLPGYANFIYHLCQTLSPEDYAGNSCMPCTCGMHAISSVFSECLIFHFVAHHDVRVTEIVGILPMGFF